jgi:hypothetical protein
MPLDPGEYCRHLETYLCRKNDGHLIRIVGPAFEKVCGWAEQGIPLKIACAGIDRYFERYYAKGPRRRPVRIEFCEADILDAFDEWRRAVGVAGVTARSQPPSLPAHLERVLLKLTTSRAEAGAAPIGEALDRAIEKVEAIRGAGRTPRGQARAGALRKLDEIDRDLSAALRDAATADELARDTREAERELEGFAGRMPADARERAITAAVDRALRERARVPRIRYD